MISEQVAYGFNWASWSSIIAGGVTALALSIVLAIIGVALGFKVVHPKSDEPFSGLGKTFGIWSAVSVIIALAGGGYVAGLFAARNGLAHGFLVWALVVIAASCFSSVAVGAAVRTVGTAVRGLGHGAAMAAGTAGKGVSHLASQAASELRNQVQLNFDSDRLNQTVVGVLRDTGVETLQPEHLKDQMREAKSDLRELLRKLSLSPSEREQIFSDFLDKEKNRLKSLTGDIDKKAAVTALMSKRGIPQDEAEKMLDNALEAYNHTVDKAKDAIAEAKEHVKDAREQMNVMADRAREKADAFSNTAAKAALGAAVALILAACVSMLGGLIGVYCSGVWVSVQKVIVS